MSKILDAVSVVLTFEDEVFAFERQFYLNAFPGYWAFPGGKVDPSDEKVKTHKLIDHLDPRLLACVFRETHEELGIDLSEFLDKNEILGIHFLGLAITPDFNPYRFATHFFKVELKHKLAFKVDENEARSAAWVKSTALLQNYKDGKILAVPPVIKVIEALGSNPKLKKIDDLNFNYDPNLYVPMIESIGGVKQLMPLSHTLPPATRTNAFLIGEVIVDPSPKDLEEYEKFKRTLCQFQVRKIFLTHHHPDHFEFSNKLARDLNLPILLSSYTFDRIIERDQKYFDDLNLTFIKEGDVVTQWLHHNVLAMEIPGHDEGQLALYPENLSWFIAGDLFQGIGTVVIGGSEGDMEKYFKTLERIITLSPKVLFPSHGIGLGGVFILEKTLSHRKQREEEVFTHHQQGLSSEEMLPKIYEKINKELWPFALMNIEKHLEKLRKEKRIS